MKVEIIFTQDWKTIKKGTIVSLKKKQANQLIAEGIAEIAPKYWYINNLYVGEIIVVDEFHEFGYIKKSHHKRWAIFTLESDSLVCDRYAFRHALTGKIFCGNNTKILIEHGIWLNDMVVNEYSVKQFSSIFFAYMLKNNLTENSILLKEDIAKLEQSLNKENNEKTNNNENVM